MASDKGVLVKVLVSMLRAFKGSEGARARPERGRLAVEGLRGPPPAISSTLPPMR